MELLLQRTTHPCCLVHLVLISGKVKYNFRILQVQCGHEFTERGEVIILRLFLLEFCIFFIVAFLKELYDRRFWTTWIF